MDVDIDEIADVRMAVVESSHGKVTRVDPDPAKAYRCTVTIAECGGHECRVNRLTHELFDRSREYGLRHVAVSAQDDEADIERWSAWLRKTFGIDTGKDGR